MKLMYWNTAEGTYDLIRQLQDMADARKKRSPDFKIPKMYYNYMQQKCHEQAAVLPPLKVFLGWTPMKEWISKCKPFIPSEKNKVMLIDSINFTDENFKQQLDLIKEANIRFREYCNHLYFSVGKDGNENL